MSVCPIARPSIQPQNLDSAITQKNDRSLLMKFSKWIDEKVEIIHVLLFCLSTINFLLLHVGQPEVSVPLTYNGKNCGSCDNLTLQGVFS